ncbi:glycosyltransferase family 39 protein [Ruminococcus difficilis]|uniref:Glycosyltransferase family 39 protein n=1 Tax=Ruminococcus difficilis TaxID=2763069 RepID=A0A934TZC0_9FIRM|nr:glycosyltransferase family 39 protein [Ruminococcus difficilis]MBK6087613.1 glycosyltransferase family 39 protein [Ruminococcus difficilis]
MKKIGNFVVRTIDYVFVAWLTIILLASVVCFSETISTGVIKYILIAIILIGITLFVMFGERIFNKLRSLLRKISSISVGKMALFLFLFVVISKIFFVFLFNNDADKTIDMRLYKSFATQIANNGIITENTVPASMYKYQVIYGLFLSPVVKIFGNDSRALTAYLSILFAIAVVLLFDIIRVYTGKTKAFVGLLLFNILPVGLFETQLLIHETPLLFFYILSFWLLLKSLNHNYHIVLRLITLLLSAILIAFGNKINQGGTVVIISYCIFALALFCKDRITAKRVIWFLTTVCCYALCFVVISGICTSYVNSVVKPSETDSVLIEHSTENRLTLGWGLYLGTNIEHAGHWNKEDHETYQKYTEFDNQEDALDYQKEIINERVQVFVDKPWIIPGHLFRKIKGLWGGLFLPFAYEEGNSINSFVLHGLHGLIYKAICAIGYLSFILLCTVILFSHKRHKNCDINSFYSPISQFKMMIIGLTSVLFLFEVMPKYVSHMQIVMFTIGIICVDGFIDNSKRIHDRVLRKKIEKE